MHTKTGRYCLHSDSFHLKKMELISNLMNGLAHDLKNTLLLFSGYMVLIENEVDNKVCDECRKEVELDEYIKTIKKILKSTEDLLNRMIGFSKGDWKEEMKKINIDETIKNKVNPLLNGNKHKVEVKLNSNNFIWGNESVFTQLLINLVINADNAISERGNKGKIILRTTIENGYLVIMVKDNGRGMTKEEKEKMFEPYFTRQGTGLGLFMVWQAVELHCGKISVNTEFGKGTEVIVKIPVIGD